MQDLFILFRTRIILNPQRNCSSTKLHIKCTLLSSQTFFIPVMLLGLNMTNEERCSEWLPCFCMHSANTVSSGEGISGFYSRPTYKNIISKTFSVETMATDVLEDGRTSSCLARCLAIFHFVLSVSYMQW
jgi:hypothetical protein